VPDHPPDKNRASEEAPDYGRPMPFGSMPSYTLDELIEMQGVKPLDVDKILGVCAGDNDDAFDEAIREIRKYGTRE